ncbi:unnamed protein product [Clonostachys byssicola]|uniref:Zn(2)-C6 fungal-type domain-containing protein n=1 Tax=Clonostachys byssicola TaxID=160290 RepID=A0A9N9U7T5_9HYPO|nr:unnamed protein product [Clonostachys byssicola]
MQPSSGRGKTFRWPRPWMPSMATDGDQAGDGGAGSPGDDGAQDDTSSRTRPQKRQAADTDRAARCFPRKRALTACQLCRVRKIKCNNARPACLACTSAGAECVYGDSRDHTSFDPASVLILERLDKLDAALGALSYSQQAFLSTTSSLRPSLGDGVSLTPQPTADTLHGLPSTAQDDWPVDGDQSENDDVEWLMNAQSAIALDAVLRWPIFQGRHPQDGLRSALGSIVHDTASGSDSEEDVYGNDNRDQRHRPTRVSIREDAIPGLVEKFLLYVHIKNPVLDHDKLRKYAKTVREEGPGWDGKSCLVLMACALGCIAKPFDNQDDLVALAAGANSTSRYPGQRELAEVYYKSACRRLGMLGISTLTSQCYFLAGVYLMYTFRQLDAWRAFVHASSNLHVYLQFRSSSGHDSQAARRVKSLEQRLYWSCFKSECEVRLAIALPGSSLSSLQYPDLFPSPPQSMDSHPSMSWRPLPDMTPSSEGSPWDANSSASQRFDASLEERSWYYYLTEIGLRRMINGLLKDLYSHENSAWLDMSILVVVQRVKDFDAELSQWFEGLPDCIRYDRENIEMIPADELQYFVRARYLEVQAWLFRPIVYLAAHGSSADAHSSTLNPLVDQAVFYHTVIIDQHCVLHRHHGTWFSMRSTVTAAFVIIAAFRSGHCGMSFTEMEEVIARAIRSVKFWENESQDLVSARTLLEAELSLLRTEQ